MRTRKIISFLALGGIIAIGIVAYVRHREDFELLTSVSVGAIALVLLLRFCLMVCQAVQLKILTDTYGMNLSFAQWFGISRMTALTNMMIPLAGGTSLKAVYMKKMFDFKYSSFIATTGIAAILRLMTIALGGVILLAPAWATALPLLIVALAVFVATLGFLLVGHRLPARFTAFWKPLARVAEEWRTIRKNTCALGKLLCSNLLIFILAALSVYVSFRTFDIDISLSASGVITVFSMLTGFIRLVPANLGITEAVFISLAVLFGTSVNEGVHAAALNRVITLACAILFSSGLVFPMLKQKKV